MSPEVLLALIGAFGLMAGGVALKVTEFALGRGTRSVSEATAFRTELRAEVIRLTAESSANRADIAHTDKELDDCRQRGYDIQTKYGQLQAMTTGLEIEISRLNAEIKRLIAEISRLSGPRAAQKAATAAKEGAADEVPAER